MHKIVALILDGGSLIKRNRNQIIIILSLVAIFLVLYVTLGVLLSTTLAFSQCDILFNADVPRVINDIAVSSGWHGRTNVHPIYVLLANPIGNVLKYFLHSDVLAAVVFNSFCGAVSVGLAFLFFGYIRRIILVPCSYHQLSVFR